MSEFLEYKLYYLSSLRTLARYARRPHYDGPNATLLIYY